VHTFDVPPLPAAVKGKRVGYFGGWAAVKGIDTLLDVALRMNDVQFILFTNPPEAMLDGRGIYGYENVLVFGGYNRDDLPRLVNLVAAVIVPSKNESYGLVAREVRGLGVPVVCSRVGGLDGTVNPGDVEGFVKALREVLA
jgi:glycosyltransferase involved in cell wall biosynthesis